jgi:hypothetical protein
LFDAPAFVLRALLADPETPARLVYAWMQRRGGEDEPFAFVELPDGIALRVPSQTFVSTFSYLDALAAQVGRSYAALEVAERIGKHREMFLDPEVRRMFADGMAADQFSPLRGRRQGRRGR